MSRKAGQLLWNRVHVVFPPDTVTVEVDTGITAESLAGLPPMGDGTVASRVQVIPLAPTDNWGSRAVVGEPFLDPTTRTVHVRLGGGLAPEPPFQLSPLNVLFWAPHSIASPGDADPYNVVL